MKILLFYWVLLAIPVLINGQGNLYISCNDAKVKDGTEIRLSQILPKRLAKSEKIWSTKVSNHKFAFLIKANGPELYYLKGSNGGEVLFLDTGKANIILEDSLFKRLIVNNNNTAADYKKYKAQLDSIQLIEDYGVARVDYDRYINGKNVDEIISKSKLRKRDSLSTELQKALVKYVLNWTRLNPTSGINSKILHDQVSNIETNDLKKTFYSLPNNVQLNQWGKELKYVIDSTSIGGVLPELNTVDTIGTPFNIQAYKGKYVLLDIWASWCIPCRKENPNIRKIANKYRQKNFEVVSISIDLNKNAWRKAIAEGCLTWKQTIDANSSDKILAKLYLPSIPANFLLNKKGKIIAKNLYGEELFRIIDNILVNDH
ncbi:MULTISPECIES: TlpA disulfide reductase family protein [unclassified Mucilaginibacter]|uniref:TlpA family protein disulfide reductase n=1 Tax=unclassified Mucilaginibacter TaxID=2617802 RepID=UPI002AC97E70|nr:MULTISPECIES: TlpA disulfide reductase family protein [unclassified Mucilaginibacter]MEB0260873.1 TlpA disulfide reductase family protein [Mucilaginibacter sp. 10I4]MEB0279892.1 TlpA disulfide reductase family protein [Mucilaginibacter sp. 10B2]MEB0302847.1 TlpA disulfide reductase family protein [Mucilaginibacter sp. 5C4]WPX24135.1 TlpA disulfide reductase family protein [Mucilaginibacter sp. 5C4]